MTANKRIIIEIISIFLVLISMILSGCLLDNNESSDTDIALQPTIKFEATVLSLSLSNDTSGRGPVDEGIIRIDKIISIDNPDDVKMQEEVEVHKNYSAEFIYSTRPAKIEKRWNLIAEDSDDGTVSSSYSFSIEDEYFVYTQTSDTTTPKDNETKTLPGLESGSKFSATASFELGKLQISTYETISG